MDSCHIHMCMQKIHILSHICSGWPNMTWAVTLKNSLFGAEDVAQWKAPACQAQGYEFNPWHPTKYIYTHYLTTWRYLLNIYARVCTNKFI